MPGLIKTPADEKRWSRAKEIVTEQMGHAPKEDEWALVNHIFQGMRRTKHTPKSSYIGDIVMTKKSESDLQKEYKDYFFETMDTHKIDGLGGLSEGKMKAFFNDVSEGWEIGKGKKSSVSQRLDTLARKIEATISKNKS